MFNPNDDGYRWMAFSRKEAEFFIPIWKYTMKDIDNAETNEDGLIAIKQGIKFYLHRKLKCN